MLTILWRLIVATGMGLLAFMVFAALVALIGERPPRWVPAVVVPLGLIGVLVAVVWGWRLSAP